MKRRTLVMLLATGWLAACSTSPTGRNQLILMDDNEVAALGLQSFSTLEKQEKISQDRKANRYVRCVAEAVVREIPPRYMSSPQDWKVVLFDSKEVNAFALPGSRIGIYTGIFKAARNQDQLAAVIGHEVSHVLARHANERMSQSQLAGVGLAVADSALQGTSYQQPAMAALGLGTQVGVLLPYGREQETEADVLGLELMASAGFRPQQAVELWRNMASISGGNKPPELLSTHPSDDHRLQRLQEQLAVAEPLYEKAHSLGRKPQCQM